MEPKNARTPTTELWTDGQYDALAAVSPETLATWSRSGSRQTWNELEHLHVVIDCCAPLSHDHL